MSMPNAEIVPHINQNKSLQIQEIINFISSLRNNILLNRSLMIRSSNHKSNDISHHQDEPNNDPLRIEYSKLCNNLDKLKGALSKLLEIQEEQLGKGIRTSLQSIHSIFEDIQTQASSSNNEGFFLSHQYSLTKLQSVNKDIKKLKRQIPSLQKPSFVNSITNFNHHHHNYSQLGTAEEDQLLSVLKVSEIFEKSSSCEYYKSIYCSLKKNEQICLLCFAVFPEDEEITKRLMTNWWVGEGLITVPQGETAEKIAGEILSLLKEKGLIEAVDRKRRTGEAKRFRIHPLVRSVLLVMAKNSGGLFDYEDSDKFSRFCFVEADSEQVPEINSNNKIQQYIQNWRKDLGQHEQTPKTLFNVNEPYPDRRLEILSKNKNVNAKVSVVDWLLKMNHMKVLYLGRWKTSAEHHIEVENVDFLEGLKNMKDLRFLSLQGIFGIAELPDSINKLESLRILDLKACHNLESLPKGVSSLQFLTHLDISECYLLDHMPKGLSSLKNLQVFKGFVIGEERNHKEHPCALKDLTAMKSLRKLSISISRLGDFPTEDEIKDFNKLEKLTKLTLAWGGNSKLRKNIKLANNKKPLQRKPSMVENNKLKKLLTRKKSQIPKQVVELELKLQKLDLQCYPEAEFPCWVVPSKQTTLKKLYIRGGNLRDLGKENKWEVESLRLKFLIELRMNWRELLQTFKELKYLEKVGCPMITCCPCDERGVWLNPNS